MHKHTTTTIDRALAQNVKITDEMVRGSVTLQEVALDYITNYRGTNSFVQDIAIKATRYTLSPAQMRGALNVMISEARLDRATLAAAANDKPLVIDFSETLAQNLAIIVEGSPTTKTPNGYYTIVFDDTGDYRTLRLTDCAEYYNKPQGTQIASFLSGQDNESQYTGFAFVNGSQYKIWSKWRSGTALNQALIALLNTDEPEIYGQAYALRSGNCFVCNRRLTTPQSIASGIGPICAANLGIDQVALAAPRKAPVTREQAQAAIDELFPN